MSKTQVRDHGQTSWPNNLAPPAAIQQKNVPGGSPDREGRPQGSSKSGAASDLFLLAAQRVVNDVSDAAMAFAQRKINACQVLARGRQLQIPAHRSRAHSGKMPKQTVAEWDKGGMFRLLAKYSRRRARDISRFCRARQAATAVEFALIAPAFFALLIAIFQTAFFMFAQMALQDAAEEAGRYFLTGQAQNGNWSASNIQTKVCPMIQALMTCANVIVVVQNASSFSAANTSAPALYSNGQPITSFTYAPGTPGEVMVVQLVYKWSVISGPLGFVLSNLPNSAAEIMGVSAFMVEPY